MASKKGVITRKDIIEDEALKWGDDYAQEIKKAVNAQEILLKQTKEMMGIMSQYYKIKTMSEYISLKQQETLITQQAVNAIKLEETAMLASEKVKKAKLVTLKQELALQSQKDRQVKSSIKLTIDEKIQLQETAKALKSEARERLGLIGTYEKLNKKRQEAQTTLANLLSAEKKNVSEIIIAQREFEKLDARVKAVDASIKNYSKNIGNYKSAFSGLNSTMRDLISTFGIVGGMALFGTIIKDIFSVIKDFDRQLIAVGKTTNITGEDLKQFGRDVVELGGRLDGISIQGLLKATEIAGQLGVKGSENLLKFGETIEKLKLTSDIISDESVQDFAKFIEVSSDSVENADRLGSVITDLGNNFATTEKQVLSNATEIQKGIAVYDAAAPKVIALGAATSALGSDAAVSGTAIQKTFGIINNAVATGKNLEKVLKLTKLTQEELSEQFASDSAGVFQKFIKGLHDAKQNGENLSVVLNDVGIKEDRQFKVVGSLAVNYDLMADAIERSSIAYEENTALNIEAAAAAESIDSILGDIRDKWEQYILNTNDANDGTKTITTALKFLRDNLQGIISGFIKYGSVVLTFVGVMKTYNLIIAAWTALKVAANAAQIRFALSTGIGTKAILAQAAAAREAMIAQGAMNVAVAATPWGLILAAIAAVVVAYQIFNDTLTEQEEQLERIKRQNESLQESESYYSEVRDKNREKNFKAIEQEIALRKARGESAKKLDEEEITRKKAVVQAQIDVFKMLEDTENQRTEKQIADSEKKISGYNRELDAIKRLDEINGRTSPRNAQRSTWEYMRNEEQKKLDVKKAFLSENTRIANEEEKKLREILSDLDQDSAVKRAQHAKEESEKEKRAREKARKEYLARLKQQENDDFALREFRLKNNISLNDDILADDKKSLDAKLDALLENAQLDQALSNETLEHKLKNISWYDDSVRDLSAKEIKTLVEGGTIKRKLLDSEKLVIEQHQAKLLEIEKKRVIEQQKIIDAEVAREQKRIDSDKATQERLLNEAIEAENTKFLATQDLERMNMRDREMAIMNHERKIFDIRKIFALKYLQLQIDGLERELADNDAKVEKERISAELRKKLEEDLQKYKTEKSDLEKENYVNNTEEKLVSEQMFVERVLEISQGLHQSLTDLANAIFERKIRNIDDEIQKNEDYYDKQIELAGEDAEQKKLLEAEAEKKRQELEKKKRKEQQKQAIADRVMALAEVGFATAMGIMQSYAQLGPIAGNAGALLVGIMGAIQTAAILAMPLPKYKHGRDGGKKEKAIINDGIKNGQYVQEVIERKDGRIEMPTGKNRIVQLYEGDSVHSSVDAFNKLQRASFRTSLQLEGKKANDFIATQVFDNSYGKELYEEMKLTRKAIEKNKTNINIHTQKTDIAHELWKFKNTNWKA